MFTISLRERSNGGDRIHTKVSIIYAYDCYWLVATIKLTRARTNPKLETKATIRKMSSNEKYLLSEDGEKASKGFKRFLNRSTVVSAVSNLSTAYNLVIMGVGIFMFHHHAFVLLKV